MQDFPGNSQKAKARSETPTPPSAGRPKVERVTSGQAEYRKPGLGRKFKETFIGGSARDAAEGMITDVIIPTVRDMIFEAVESGFHRLIYGDSGRGRRGAPPSSYANVGKFNYAGISRSAPTPQPNTGMISRRSRARHDFGEIIIDSRPEANEVIDSLFEILSQYGSVPVSTLYELTGIVSSHVDHTWGWTSLQGAKARRQGDGRFVLDLPEPQKLD